MHPDRLREIAARQRVADLATIDADGGPHTVPICFAFVGAELVTAIDQKPKRTLNLTRLTNIERNPGVALLFHHYEEDWTRLWWIRASGRATIHTSGRERETAIDALVAKYEQYRASRPAGAAIRVEIDGWRSWAAAGFA